MSNDLDHFYERNLNRGSLKDFSDSLPYNLKRRFEKSVCASIFVDNVLQGYRGPEHMCNGGSGDSEGLEASCGVQEIKFWWGLRKILNIIPIAGPFYFVVGRVLQKVAGHLKWSSLYFDSKTGECLTHKKYKVAEILNEKGCQLFREGEYAVSAEYHMNAEAFYVLQNREVPSVQYGEHARLFESNRAKAQTEADALQLNNEGDKLFNEGKYSEALSKYQEALQKSQIRKECEKYRANMGKAQAEIDAINFNSQGDNLFRQGKYSEAYNKYEEACNKSRVEKELNIYVNKKKTSSQLSITNTAFRYRKSLRS